MDILELELDRDEQPVRLRSKKGGAKNWTLKELSGRERNRYLNKMKDRVKIGKNGKAMGIKNFDGYQSDLLLSSLYDEADKSVSLDMIEALPAKTQQALFDRAKEISGLDNDEEEKNEDEAEKEEEEEEDGGAGGND